MIQNQNQGRGRREEDEQNDAPNCIIQAHQLLLSKLINEKKMEGKNAQL